MLTLRFQTGGDLLRRAGARSLPGTVEQMLADHRRWVESGGSEGLQADFTGSDLSRLDLTDAMLQGAKLERARLRGTILRRANLSDAELGEAWLQGADLTKADLRRAGLAGANFRDANLAEAELSGARGLLAGQLGGANLAGAHLPDEANKFDGLANVSEASKTTQGLFYSILFVCAYAWLTVASTHDPQLVNNAAQTASRLPILGTDIPLVQFYLVAPLLLLALYVYFHLCLQRLWEELGELPAVFPDGRPLDKKAYPWMFNVLVRAHAPRLRDQRSPLTVWQVRMTMFLGWGLVPLTLVVLWARFLRSHDWWITAVHIGLVAVALGAGLGFRRLAAATLRGSERRAFQWQRAWGDARARGALVTSAAAAVLTLFAYGSIEGINPLSANRGITVETHGWRHAADPRIWVPRLMHACGYNTFAQLDDAPLSTKPANWSGGNEQHEVDGVRGADCEGRNLRYALAYNAFGFNGYFMRADAEGCDFRSTDLRYADFREARLVRANFRDADLRKADFRRADCTGAKMPDGDLKDSKFDGAIAVDIDLSRADLTGADFTDAVLRGADLEGAILKNAVLAGADLTDAHGLTPAQLMTARISPETRLPAEVSRNALLSNRTPAPNQPAATRR